MFRYLCFLTVLMGARSSSVPMFIKPCKTSDMACILASAQEAVPFFTVGIPELGVQPLDPMNLDFVKGDQGGLSLTFKNSTVKGMKECIVENIKHDLQDGLQVLVTRCSVNMTGHYKLNGRLLVLPIRGEGKYNIKIRNIVLKTTTKIVPVQGDDGKEHWHIAEWNFTSDVKNGASFDFHNLFNGNKFLAIPVERFVNANWKEVMHEIAPPIVKAIVGRVVEAVEALFKAVPAEQLQIL